MWDIGHKFGSLVDSFIIIIIIIIMAIQPFVGPLPLFQFLDTIHSP
jgi:hypothetical protein